jgi:Ca-activated chloride channel homolog
MVLFDDAAYKAKPLNLVGETAMDKIKEHILEVRDQGGTNMEAGIKEGTALFEEYLNVDETEYENRIIFLTDAMPNTGLTNEDGLLGMTEKNAKNKIYTTFIGIGVDFNTELIEEITKVRGANYYSVHSGKDFKTRMDDEFELMVTPLVFNLNLKLEGSGYEIEKVYGSPEANEATGEIMKVNTLFPSRTQEGETRGGLVLLKLKKTTEAGEIKLSASYEDRSGNLGSDERLIEFPTWEENYYDNLGIRKGILLARYANLLKNWMIDERAMAEGEEEVRKCYVYTHLESNAYLERGIMAPRQKEEVLCRELLGRWERQSINLSVNENYKALFSDFKDYYENEMSEIGDEDLKKEVEVLDKLGE